MYPFGTSANSTRNAKAQAQSSGKNASEDIMGFSAGTPGQTRATTFVSINLLFDRGIEIANVWAVPDDYAGLGL